MKLHITGILVAVLILAGAVGTFTISRRAVPDAFKYDFEKIHRLYDEGKYALAAGGYQNLLEKYAVESPDLYFNLANSYFKSGKIGPAILYYKKALKLAPGDREIKFNLDFARRDYGLITENNDGWFQQKFEAFLGLTSLNRAVKAALICYWLFLAGLTAALFARKKSPRYIAVVLAAVFAVTLAYAALQYYVQAQQREGVILADGTEAMYTPDEADDPAFSLNGGVAVRILNQQAGWYQVQTDDGRVGWIKIAALGKI